MSLTGICFVFEENSFPHVAMSSCSYRVKYVMTEHVWPYLLWYVHVPLIFFLLGPCDKYTILIKILTSCPVGSVQPFSCLVVPSVKRLELHTSGNLAENVNCCSLTDCFLAFNYLT
jgi:hypothetical protein